MGFAKFGRYVVTANETERGEVVQRYPTWWLESPEVGFMSWSPSGRSSARSDTEGLQHIFQNWPLSMGMVAAVMAVGAVAIVAFAAHQWGIQRGAQYAKL